MSSIIVGSVLGLALLDTLSPTVVGVTLYVLLARPPRRGVLLTVYLGTVAAAYFALGVVLMLGLGAILPAINPAVGAWVQGAAGVATFIGSWFIPGRKNPDGTAIPARPLTARSLALLGLGTWLFEFYTAVPYFAAIGVMTSANLKPAAWLLLLGAYVTIMILPGIVIQLVWGFLSTQTRQRLEQWQNRLDAGSRTTLSWIVGIAGVLIFLDALPAGISITIP